MFCSNIKRLEQLSVTICPQNVTIDGVTHDCTHLTATVHTIVATQTGQQDIRVRVSYKSHVYSEKCETHQADFLDELNRPRVFLPERYALCLNLPQICEGLVLQNGNTWVSTDASTNMNLACIPGANLVTGVHYVVFYYLYPSSVEGIDVEMVVISAFEREVNFDHIRRRYKVQQKIKEAFYQDKRVPPAR